MKTYNLPIHNIRIHVSDDGSGSIFSDLASPLVLRGEEEMCAALNTLESVILAHACAGIDVSSQAYIKGIEVAVDAVFKHYG